MAEVVKLQTERPPLHDAEAEAQVARQALAYGPEFRRAWIRTQEARGIISEIGAARIIRVLGLK